MKKEKVEPQFGTIYIGYRPQSGYEPFRYLNVSHYLRGPVFRDVHAEHAGVWVMRNNELGHTKELMPLTASWLNRKMRGLKKQLASRQKKLDIYNNIASLVS